MIEVAVRYPVAGIRGRRRLQSNPSAGPSVSSYRF